VSVEKFSFLVIFGEKWKFEEIAIFDRKIIYKNPSGLKKLFFDFFIFFWIFDAELQGA
jgi:hypothetical protein